MPRDDTQINKVVEEELINETATEETAGAAEVVTEVSEEVVDESDAEETTDDEESASVAANASATDVPATEAKKEPEVDDDDDDDGKKDKVKTDQPYVFEQCSLSVVLRILPEAEGDRNVAITVRSHDEKPVVRYVKLSALQLPPQVIDALDTYKAELPQREVAAKERKEKKTATAVKNSPRSKVATPKPDPKKKKDMSAAPTGQINLLGGTLTTAEATATPAVKPTPAPTPVTKPTPKVTTATAPVVKPAPAPSAKPTPKVTPAAAPALLATTPVATADDLLE